MSAERRGNPFGWIFLGFIVGVLATFGVILFLTAGIGGYDEGPDELRTVADEAAAEAMALPPVAAPVAPPKIEPAVIPAPTASTGDTPPRQTPTIDSQMADDAAAAGMTSRADQPTN